LPLAGANTIRHLPRKQWKGRAKETGGDYACTRSSPVDYNCMFVVRMLDRVMDKPQCTSYVLDTSRVSPLRSHALVHDANEPVSAPAPCLPLRINCPTCGTERTLGNMSMLVQKPACRTCEPGLRIWIYVHGSRRWWFLPLRLYATTWMRVNLRRLLCGHGIDPALRLRPTGTASRAGFLLCLGRRRLRVAVGELLAFIF